MSWATPLYRYKSLSLAHRYAPRSYHIPKNLREPAGTNTSGYLLTEATQKMSNKMKRLQLFKTVSRTNVASFHAFSYYSDNLSLLTMV